VSETEAGPLNGAVADLFLPEPVTRRDVLAERRRSRTYRAYCRAVGYTTAPVFDGLRESVRSAPLSRSWVDSGPSRHLRSAQMGRQFSHARIIIDSLGDIPERWPCRDSIVSRDLRQPLTSRFGAFCSHASVRSSRRRSRSARGRVTPTAARRLPHHTFSQVSGAVSTAVRIPPSPASRSSDPRSTTWQRSCRQRETTDARDDPSRRLRAGIAQGTAPRPEKRPRPQSIGQRRRLNGTSVAAAQMRP
jgi:hypothetical protein